MVCENAGQAVALAFKAQRSKDDQVRGAFLQYLTLCPNYFCVLIYCTFTRLGDSLNLTCESGLSAPPPALEWLIEGRRLHEGVRALDTLYPLHESR